MKKIGVLGTSLALGAVAGLVLPITSASAAPSGNGRANPSCAAFWAQFKNEFGFIPPLGIAQKDLGNGFAKFVAQQKVSDNSGYCGILP